MAPHPKVEVVLRFRRSTVDEVSIVSFNLLAPSYDRYDPPCAGWQEVRRSCLKRWVARLGDFDVLAVQELDLGCGVLADLLEELGPRGFDVLVQDRGAFSVVNATFFNARRLSLLWAVHRSRVLLGGWLMPDGRELCIVNVHLEAGPGARNERQRVSQLASALDHARKNGPATLGWVVCGDFNDELEEGSALRAALVREGLAPVPSTGPTFGAGFRATFDHLWASASPPPRCPASSSSLMSAAGRLLRTEAVLARELTGATRRALKRAQLPDIDHPSDHLPAGALFHVAPPALALMLWPSAAAPASVAEEDRLAWLSLITGAAAGGKQAAKEQKWAEAAFLDSLCASGSDGDGGAAPALVAWRAAATETAALVLRAAAGRAVLRAAGTLRQQQKDAPAQSDEHSKTAESATVATLLAGA